MSLVSKEKLEYLTYIERKLRFKGWKTKVKSEAVQLIYGYMLSIIALRAGDLNIITKVISKLQSTNSRTCQRERTGEIELGLCSSSRNAIHRSYDRCSNPRRSY